MVEFCWSSADGMGVGSNDQDRGASAEAMLPLEQSNYCTMRGRASGLLQWQSAVLKKSSEVRMMAMECGACSAQ